MIRRDVVVLVFGGLLPLACAYPDFTVRPGSAAGSPNVGEHPSGGDWAHGGSGGHAGSVGATAALGGTLARTNPPTVGASSGNASVSGGGAGSDPGGAPNGGSVNLGTATIGGATTDGGTGSVTSPNSGGYSMSDGGTPTVMGGATSRGGSSPTGGRAAAGAGATAIGGSATGGTISNASGASSGGKAGSGGTATGGLATGGLATGGIATGGRATGGVATGGIATGGAATGGLTGTDGWASRYWDCCKPSCGWTANTGTSTAVKSCGSDNSLLSGYTAKSACDTGGTAYQCWDLSPWVSSSNPNVSYGFASYNGVPCGTCFQLGFTGVSHGGSSTGTAGLVGKSMIVQVINIGGIAANQFDLLIPGGGVGDFSACSAQWGVATSALGAQYGGFLTTCSGDKTCVNDKCTSVFGSMPTLKAGCDWFTGWFNAADNPALKYQQVTCPSEITSRSGFTRPTGGT